MTTYTPNGSGHRALAVLSDGDCRAEQIPLLIFTHSAAPSREKKARHLIRQMIADRLVERRDAGWLAITSAGLDALASALKSSQGEADAWRARALTAEAALQSAQAERTRMREALRAAKREMWDIARHTWALADFKNWAVIQQIDAALQTPEAGDA